MENNNFEDINIENNNENEKEKKNNNFIVVIILLILIVLILGGYILYDKLLSRSDKVLDNDSVETSKPIDNDTKPIGKKLTIYEDNNNKYISSKPSNNTSNYTTYTITCETENCELFVNDIGEPSGQNNYVLINENNNGVLYNYNEDRKVMSFKNVESFLFNYYGGLVIKANGKYGVYNLELEKLTIPFIYDEIKSIGYYDIGVRGAAFDVVLGSGFVAIKNSKYGVVNYKDGSSIIDFKYDDIVCYKYGDYDSETSTYKTSPKEYCKAKKDGEYEIYEYNRDTSKINLTSLKLNDFYGIFENKYAYANKDGKLILINLNDYSILSTFNDFNTTDTPFYLYNYIDDNKDSNILIQFSKKDSNLCIEYYYNLNTKENHTWDNIECAQIAKPIIYLYPEKDTNVTVTFEHNNLLTTTYPKFINKWNVLAKPNGDLYDKNGKYYYGLYWEEKPVHFVDFSEGFYVDKNDAIKFLEEKLSYIGLSDKEKNEFIMYWLPILEKNGKNLVYFELTEERESVNKIYINPKPDSLLRIVMHVKKVNNKTNIKEQKLVTFERKGFTAVEWGGYNYTK